MTKNANARLSDRAKVLVRVDGKVSFRTTAGKLRNREVGDFRDFNLALWSAMTMLDTARSNGDNKFPVTGILKGFGEYQIQLSV